MIVLLFASLLSINKLTALQASPANLLAWVPGASDRLQYQLGKLINLATDLKPNVTAYGIDGFDTPTASVLAMVSGRWLYP